LPEQSFEPFPRTEDLLREALVFGLELRDALAQIAVLDAQPAAQVYGLPDALLQRRQLSVHSGAL
jgi:hypothetical protein